MEATLELLVGEKTFEDELVKRVGRYTNTLRPQPQATLTPSQTELLRRLERFEAPYLEEKLLEQRTFATSREYDDAFTKFKKYAALTQIQNGEVGMVSKVVDSVWHQFILFTREYADFCNSHLGRFLHHQPALSTKPVDSKATRNFRQSYRAVFGQIPPVWGAGAECYSTSCASPSSCAGDGADCGSGGSVCNNN
jgi:hypothetical protein